MLVKNTHCSFEVVAWHYREVDLEIVLKILHVAGYFKILPVKREYSIYLLLPHNRRFSFKPRQDFKAEQPGNTILALQI